MNEDRKRRYPGLRSFEVGQQAIYYGRGKETSDLFDLTKISTATVLYSRSGLGKSSLLNAGLLPKLQEAGYWPVRIRFQKQNLIDKKDNTLSAASDEQPVATDSPITIVVNTLRTEFETAYKPIEATMARLPSSSAVPDPFASQKQDGTRLLANIDYVEGEGYLTTLPILYDSEEPRLWEYVKIHPFPNAIGIALLFDQFEEFFAYTVAQRNEFLLQLAELLHDRPPTRVINWMMKNTPDDPSPEQIAWGCQPLVKCVFAIRSDRLFEMDSLKQHIPLVFRNRYELPPLQEKAARDAIERPAKEPGDFDTPGFTYQKETLSLIINTLQDKNKEIDSSQLQMVCSYIEMNVLPDAGVDKQLIPDEQKIKDIIDEYYNRQLCSLKNEADIQLAGYVLEEYFVVKGQRVGIENPVLLTYLENRSEIIEQLKNVRLIRAEPTTRGTDSYELSHDKLIEPIEKAKSRRDSDRYYSQRLALLQNSEDIKLACQVLEDHFVARSQRVTVTEANLQQYLTNRPDLIQKLIDARLIRLAHTNAGATYELEHDMLVEPVEKAKEKRQEENNRLKLIEDLETEKKERNRLASLKNGLVIAISLCVLLLIVGGYYLFQNKLLKDTATSALATQQYSIGKEHVAYRLWQKLNPTIPQTKLRLFTPFAGLSTQTDLADTTLPYVATVYRDNTLEVWQRTPSATYEKIIDKSVQSPTSFRLKNKRLVFAEGDSLLQVIDLPTRKKIFPVGSSRYRLLTTNMLRSTDAAFKNTVLSSSKTVLSPRAKWLVTIDSINLAHLYNLNQTGREHPFFQDVTNAIQEHGLFSSDLIAFSATDNFLLLKVPLRQRFYLFDLRTESPPTLYEGVFQASFSSTGQYATLVSTTGRLTVLDLVNQRVRYSTFLAKPNSPIPVFTLAFTRQDSTLVVVTTQAALPTTKNKAAADPPTFTIHTIDLQTNQPIMKPLVRRVSAYQIFGWAGHLVVTNKNQTESYNYTIATGAKVRCPFRQFTTTCLGKTYMIYTKPDTPTDRNQYLYNAVLNKKVKITLLTDHDGAKLAFYAPPGGPDETLVNLTPDRLLAADLIKSAKAGNKIWYKVFPAHGTLFVPTTLSIAGPLIKVRRQDGLTFCFQPNYRKNLPDYLDQRIYPQLTKADERELGLSN